jgi:hypothetical protein
MAMCVEATDIAGAIAAGNSKGLRPLFTRGKQTRRREPAPLPVVARIVARVSNGGTHHADDSSITSAAVALAMKAIHSSARQYVAAGPFSREPRAPCHEEVFRPRPWPLPIADATSVQSLFCGS